MGRFGIGEILIIAVLVFVIFGGRRLPELGKALGSALLNFRRAVDDPEKNIQTQDEVQENKTETDALKDEIK